MANSLKAVIAVNLGTPEAPTPGAVGAYLAEFLADPRVVDLPRWLWLPLLRLVIIPLRRSRSAAAYARIWGPEGSPLLVRSRRLASALGQALDGEAEVHLAMRYGRPALAGVLEGLRDRGISELTVLPLYPQYSRTTTASVYDRLQEALDELGWAPALHAVRDYHDDPAWVAAVAQSIRSFQEHHGRPDRLMFSLHGIPQRYVDAGDPYQRQCEAGTRRIAAELGLRDEEVMLCYQSRVGREAWLQPYTETVLQEMPAAGVRRVQVVCPGFAVDCLETLEEIAMRDRNLFLESGGERLEYIPALNDSATHVDALAGVIRASWAAGPPRQGIHPEGPV